MFFEILKHKEGTIDRKIGWIPLRHFASLPESFKPKIEETKKEAKFRTGINMSINKQNNKHKQAGKKLIFKHQQWKVYK